MTRVAIVEDQDLVREGILRLLNAESDLSVVAVAARGSDVVELVEQHKPDVLVLDLSLPDLDGLEAMRRARQARGDLQVVVLTMHRDLAYVRRAREYGAVSLLDSPVIPAGRAALAQQQRLQLEAAQEAAIRGIAHPRVT